MYKEIKCTRCGKNFEFIKQTNIQFGKETLFFDRDYSKSYLECDLYVCSECGEFHFFKHEECPKEELVKCKWCLKKVDPSYPHCPNCGHKEGDKW